MTTPKYRIVTNISGEVFIQRHFKWLKWITMTEWYTMPGLYFGSEQSADQYIINYLS